MVKMMELAEIAKLTTLIRDKALSKVNADWKSLFKFLCDIMKMNKL